MAQRWPRAGLLSTMPTFSVSAYMVVRPMKVHPRGRSSQQRASDSSDMVGMIPATVLGEALEESVANIEYSRRVVDAMSWRLARIFRGAAGIDRFDVVVERGC